MERLADRFLHAHVHQPEHVLAVARAGDDLQVRVLPPHQARGAQVRLRVVGGQHEYLGLVGLRRAQQLRSRRVAEEQVDAAEAARLVHLIGRMLQRHERDALRAQHAGDDLADPAEAGDDHPRRVGFDRVELARRFLRPHVQCLRRQHHQQRGQRHRQGDRQHQRVALDHADQPLFGRLAQHHECKLAAAGQQHHQAQRVGTVEPAQQPPQRPQQHALQQQQGAAPGRTSARAGAAAATGPSTCRR